MLGRVLYCGPKWGANVAHRATATSPACTGAQMATFAAPHARSQRRASSAAIVGEEEIEMRWMDDIACTSPRAFRTPTWDPSCLSSNFTITLERCSCRLIVHCRMRAATASRHLSLARFNPRPAVCEFIGEPRKIADVKDREECARRNLRRRGIREPSQPLVEPPFYRDR
jgi:hypothetical protein